MMIVKGHMNPFFCDSFSGTFLIETKINTVITLQKKLTIKEIRVIDVA